MQKDITSATEYKIGNTTYIVNVKFAPNCKENISDVVRRLIERDIKKQAAKPVHDFMKIYRFKVLIFYDDYGIM